MNNSLLAWMNKAFYCDHLVICATYYNNIEDTELRNRF